MPSSFCLNTPRLWIRPLQGNDHQDLAEMMQNPAVMAAWEHTFTEREIDQWILRNLQRYLSDGAGYWAAVSKENGEMIGQIGLVKTTWQEEAVFSLGYMLKPQYWHRGYATEAAKACVRHAFYQIKRECVIADIRPENTASIAVARRLRMQPVGTIEKKVYGKSLPHTVYLLEKPKLQAPPSFLHCSV